MTLGTILLFSIVIGFDFFRGLFEETEADKEARLIKTIKEELKK